MTTLSIIMTIAILALFIGAIVYAQRDRPLSLTTDAAAALAEELRRIATRQTALRDVYPSEDGLTIEVETTDEWAIVFTFNEDTGAISGIESVTTPEGDYYEVGGEVGKETWLAVRDVMMWWLEEEVAEA